MITYIRYSKPSRAPHYVLELVECVDIHIIARPLVVYIEAVFYLKLWDANSCSSSWFQLIGERGTNTNPSLDQLLEEGTKQSMCSFNSKL